MKRIVMVVMLAVACGREQAVQETPAAKKPAAKPRPKMEITGVSSAPTPTVDYKSAAEWFATAPAFRFVLTEGDIRAEGMLARTTPGAERIRFTHRGEEWIAIAQGNGIAWYRGGKRAENVPAELVRVWQRTTVLFDPQKREGEAQLAGTETMDGVRAMHYRFTDANNGNAHDVWVSADGGHIVRMTIEPRPELREAFPAVTLAITGVGESVNIEEPR